MQTSSSLPATGVRSFCLRAPQTGPHPALAGLAVLVIVVSLGFGLGLDGRDGPWHEVAASRVEGYWPGWLPGVGGWTPSARAARRVGTRPGRARTSPMPGPAIRAPNGSRPRPTPGGRISSRYTVGMPGASARTRRSASAANDMTVTCTGTSGPGSASPCRRSVRIKAYV